MCTTFGYFALGLEKQLNSATTTETPTKITIVIIQQIVAMPIYGQEALNICHPYMTDIQRYT